MGFGIKDRLAIMQDLDRISRKGGILSQTHKTGKWRPKKSDLDNNGLIGRAIETLVGPTCEMADADYVKAELKTRDSRTHSMLTVCCFTDDELELPFEDTKIAHKLAHTVFAVHEPTGGIFQYKELFFPERKLLRWYTLDLFNSSELYRELDDDWKSLQNGTQGNYLMIEDERDTQYRRRLRLKKNFLKMIEGHENMDNNFDFEKQEIYYKKNYNEKY